MKLQGTVIEKEDVAKIGNQFCNIPFFLESVLPLPPRDGRINWQHRLRTVF